MAEQVFVSEGLAERKRMYAQAAAETIAKLAPPNRVCVQAGGHIGLWPLALANYFTVYTFEPSERNWKVLQKAVAGIPNIIALPAGLGDKAGTATVREGKKSGLDHLDLYCPGSVKVVTIDSLKLSSVAAIVLDVEGMEHLALKGAINTIKQSHPLIWIELTSRQKFYGSTVGATAAWVQSLGYDGPTRVFKRDVYFRWRGK